MRAEIVELLRPYGFVSPKWNPGKSLWLVRARGGVWTDAYCFEIYADDQHFSLAFGVECAPIRELVLSAAKRIAPEGIAENLFRSLGIAKRPCVNIFSAPSSVKLGDEYFVCDRLDKRVFEFVEKNFFRKVDSESAYLNFLMCSEDVFEWGRSASAFRLIYVGYLFLRQGLRASQYRDYCGRIPEKYLASHALLNAAGLNVSDFIEDCIEIIWQEPHPEALAR